MATNEIHARIKNKVNPALSSVLLDGELAVLRANGKSMLKIGNGSSALSDIAYVEAPWDDVSAWVDQAKSVVSVDGTKADINVQHISQSDYEQLVVTSCVLSNTVYIVSRDYIEAYGQQMKNLAQASDLSDAVNLEQVSSMIASSASETLSSIEQSDWSQSLSTEQSYIKNKPTSLPSPNALSIGTGLSAVAYDGSTPMSLVAGENIVFAKSGNEISVNAQPFPDPIDPSFAVSSGDYADALAIKNAISSTALSICILSSWMDQTKSTVSADGVKSDINIQHISQEDYESLVDDGHVLSNTVYIISGDYVEAYGQQMKNLAPGTELSDAVNLEQLNSLSSKFYQLPANGIPGSDMALSVQNALEKASVAISSIPGPVDPMTANEEGNYADALATKNALSSKANALDLLSKADKAIAADQQVPMVGHVATLSSDGNLVDSGCHLNDILRYKLQSVSISSGTIAPAITLQDRTITYLDVPLLGNMASSDAVISFTLPSKTDGYARDLILCLNVPEYSYSIDINAQYDEGQEQIQIYTNDESRKFPSIDVDAVNVFSFTEFLRGKFIMSKKNEFAVGGAE